MITLDSNKQWDKFDFNYQSIEGDENATLPFKLLVLGDFSLSDDNRQIHLLKPFKIDKKSFDRVLLTQKIAICIELTMAGEDNNIDYNDIDVSINKMACFEPLTLIESIPYLKSHQALMKRISAISSHNAFEDITFSESESILLTQCGVQLAQINEVELPFVICDINEHLYEILDLILHHEQFQKLESIWRNLQQLVSCASEVDDCLIEFLDISQYQIMDDFEVNRDVKDSLLFDVVYQQEFAQYGGQPYTAMIADYEFGAGAQDIALLRSIGKVANAAHSPFIAGVSPRFFAGDDFNSLANMGDIEELISSPKYIKWRGLQQEHLSSYIALALPRIQLRNGYSFAAGAIGPMPYEENTRLTTDKVLLGNASFAFGRCLINSFSRFAVCTDICGVQGGRVLPACEKKVDEHFPNFPIECVLSERKVSH